MLCAKYDYDLDIQVKQEEAFANGEQNGIKKGMKQGLQQGISQERIETAKRMLNKNCDISFIKEITSLSVEEIQEIRKEELGIRN